MRALVCFVLVLERSVLMDSIINVGVYRCVLRGGVGVASDYKVEIFGWGDGFRGSYVVGYGVS